MPTFASFGVRHQNEAWYAQRLFYVSWLAAAAWIASGCHAEPVHSPENGAVAELKLDCDAQDAVGRQVPDWQTSTPEAQGIDSEKLASALVTIRDQGIHVHSLLLVRNGKVLTNAYFYPYDGSSVHDLASVTKSFMTTLIAIAVEQGTLGLDDTMLSFFPDRTIANRSALKENITVRDLASMTSGLDCLKEPGEPTLAEMTASPDWMQFVLDREVVREPGTYFEYCSPGTHMLSAILQKATGMTALDFARRYLFGPLGIHDVIWPLDPQGYNTGWGELRIHPHDMAKLGSLWMHGGVWHGRRIVSQEWVEASTRPLFETREGGSYGYGWWVETEEPVSYRADGRGGQYVVVVPDYDLMLVTTGGGFTLDQIVPLLLSVLADPDEPLPPNRVGLAKLRRAVRSISEPPAASQVGPLPEIARQISGNTYALEANFVGIDSIGFEFTDGPEGVLNYSVTGSDQVISMPIGLDGVYRLSPGDYDLLEGVRGSWFDDQTFVLEYDEIANQGHIVLRMRFRGDRVTGEITDLATGAVDEFEGRLVHSS